MCYYRDLAIMLKKLDILQVPNIKLISFVIKNGEFTIKQDKYIVLKSSM